MFVEAENLTEKDFENAMSAVSVAIDDFSEKLHRKGRYEVTWDDKRHDWALYKTMQLLVAIHREKYPDPSRDLKPSKPKPLILTILEKVKEF